MSWSDWFGPETLIRLPENEIGFEYVVKFAGIPVHRGFVATVDGKPADGGKRFAWLNSEPDEIEEENNDAG